MFHTKPTHKVLLSPQEAKTMRKAYQPTINLSKPAQEELNKALLNPINASRELCQIMEARIEYLQNRMYYGIGCAPPGTMFVQPVGIKMPTEYETYTDADTHWYFIDDKNIKIMEEEMPTVRRYVGSLVEDDPIRDELEKEAKELNVDAHISIKGEHIMAVLGCETYICHNLTQLVGLIRQALMDEMPILKDFGKTKLTKKGGKKDEKAS